MSIKVFWMQSDDHDLMFWTVPCFPAHLWHQTWHKWNKTERQIHLAAVRRWSITFFLWDYPCLYNLYKHVNFGVKIEKIKIWRREDQGCKQIPGKRTWEQKDWDKRRWRQWSWKKKKKIMWDYEMRWTRWLGSSPLFINQSLDFTALHCDSPAFLLPLWQNDTQPKHKQRERERDGRAGMSPPLSLHYRKH